MSIEADLRAIVMKKMTADSPLTADTKLAEIGVDSLDMVEIVFDIEDKYKIQLPQNDDELAGATFGDICALVERHIAGAAPLGEGLGQAPA